MIAQRMHVPTAAPTRRYRIAAISAQTLTAMTWMLARKTLVQMEFARMKKSFAMTITHALLTVA